MLTIYTKPNCIFCNRAKKLLDQKGISYDVIDVTQDAESLAFLKRNGHTSVPQLYQNSTLFVDGGFEGLAKLSDTELKERLETA